MKRKRRRVTFSMTESEARQLLWIAGNALYSDEDSASLFDGADDPVGAREDALRACAVIEVALLERGGSA